MFRFRKEVYLDNNATTKISKSVLQKMTFVLKNVYGNPSSLYKTSHQSAQILEMARESLAKSINAAPNEIIFTSCASESNNTVLKILFEKYYPEKSKIISTEIEHPAVLTTLEYLKGKGAEIYFLNTNSKGDIDYAELERAIDDKTILVCAMNANNEIGSILDIKRIASIAHKKNALVFSDSVQALGKINIDVKDSNIDYASFSAHKINGPKGIGALYVKSGRPISSFIHGGHQENGLRAGTESLHNIAGFGTACLSLEEKISNKEKISNLKKYFISELKQRVSRIKINSEGNNFLSNTISATFIGANNEKLMAALDYRGISVSAGSACNTQENAPSHVLKAIGLSDEEARATLRFSISDKTTKKEIDYTLRAIEDYFNDKLPKIEAISPKKANESLLMDKSTLVLDIRSESDRKSIKSIPNSLQAEFLGIKKYLHKIPKDKRIIVVCQGGVNSPFTAYYLKSKGYRNVSFIMTGMWGWKFANKDYYDRYAGE